MNNSSVSRTTVGVLALVLPFVGLGWLGIHKFVLGYTKTGLIWIAISVLTCGIGAGILSIISFIEGIIYLTKSDSDFYTEYVTNKKEWF